MGATGATGPTGTFAAYGTYISTGARTVSVNALITWSYSLSEEPIGMEATLPSTTVILTTAGVYRIDYRIIVGPRIIGENASIELVLGGTTVLNSAVLVTDNVEIAGVAVVSTAAEDTSVALRVIGNAVNLPAGTNAFLDIIKIA